MLELIRTQKELDEIEARAEAQIKDRGPEWVNDAVTDLLRAIATIETLQTAFRQTSLCKDMDGHPCWCLPSYWDRTQGHQPVCILNRALLGLEGESRG